MNQKRETSIAIFLFLLVLLGNSVIFSIVPYISIPSYGFGYHGFMILMVYSIVALLCMAPWALKQGRKGLATTRIKGHGLRAVLEYGAYSLTLISLSYLGDVFTLPMHTALNFITPLLATVVTILVLKEKGHVHTWVALFIGIVGVLIITRPGMIPANAGVLYVLGAALGFSFCGVVIKLLSSTESPKHIAFYMLLLTSIFSIPMGIYHWQTPSLEGWGWLIAIGVLSYAVQILVGMAISKVPYMVIIPLNFVMLVFTTILSYFVFHKLIDGWTLAGAVIILAGTIYNTWKSTRSA
ncbi:MAG: DMT family transporter [Alphaproteobacteria bacterium]|nr:DMT family transporter [Alphaproteobacteria bacterium]